ncbi:MAG: sterol desaturase family protein [Undibacterium sp.]|nr:sterol desaturase family protein [Undibacterium sp.]
MNNKPKKSFKSLRVVKKIAPHLAKNAVKQTTDLVQRSGPLVTPYIASAITALSLAILCSLGVLAFHFPQYLTTPELRHIYSVDMIRHILFAAMIISGTLSLVNIILKRNRSIHFTAILLIALCWIAGGSHVPVADFPDHTPYIGLDWFILDLLGSTLIFVAIEKILPLYKGQTLFRAEWQTDLIHFAVNHFIVGLILLTVNFLIHRLFGWLASDSVHMWVQNIYFLPQLLLCMLVADLAQYWTHRSYHEVPFLWRFHAVHHSAKTMDWLAGSRQHMLELVVTRVLVLGALFVMGFSKNVMDAYIVVVGFQAVFNHANVHVNWGPLKYFIVTPDFHHWHHSSDDVAIDKNYAAHYAFLDYLFGTAVRGQNGFPEKYGVQGDYMPDGFVKQQMFPFQKLEQD